MFRELFYISNLLSLSRAPLAVLYLLGNLEWKIVALVFTALSDFLDGYLARSLKQTTSLGAYLDAIMDKVFVFCVAGSLMIKDSMHWLDFAFFISRDLFLLLVIGYLLLFNLWRKIEVRAAWTGKFTTGMQLLALLAITVGISLPPYIYLCFLLLGLLTTLELLFCMRQRGDLTR